MKTNTPPAITSLFAKVSGIACALILLGATDALATSAPLVNVNVWPSTVNPEELETAQFTLTLSGPSTHDIGIVFFMSGTARPGLDYSVTANLNNLGMIVIPAGQTSTTVTLHTLQRRDGFRRLNVAMNLVHDTISNARYRLGPSKRANLTIEVR